MHFSENLDMFNVVVSTYASSKATECEQCCEVVLMFMNVHCYFMANSSRPILFYILNDRNHLLFCN